MEDREQKGLKRQIGAIFVEKGHISEEQLALALQEQQATGAKLGEILVANYGVSRLDLASALEEQWTEDEAGKVTDHSARDSSPAGKQADRDAPTTSGLGPEVQAVLALLRRTTNDLDSRLAAVETLLAALSGAIDELRETTPAKPNNTTQETAPVAPPVERERAERPATTTEILKQLTRGPKTISELQKSLGNLDERVLRRAVADGLITTKATTLDRKSAPTDGDYYLTPAGARQIGEDPDQHPWPFRS